MKSRSGQVYLQALAVVAVAAVLGGSTASSRAQAKPAGTASHKASPAKTTAATTSSKVVMRVGKDEVTRAEMDQLIASLSPQAQQNVAAQGKRNLGEQFADMIVLDQQAEKDHLNTDSEIRQRLELDKRQLLAQAEYQKLAERIQVTPQEVSDYFNAHKDSFDSVDIYEVLVRKKSADAKAGDPGLAPAEAQSKANAILAALTSGSDIKAVSKEFSIPNVVIVDTTPRPVRHGQLTPELDKEIFSLNKGQVSKPYDTPQAIGIFQVASHQVASLENASSEIESELRQEKLNNQIEALRSSANIWLDQGYFGPAPAKGSEAAPAPEGAAPKKP